MKFRVVKIEEIQHWDQTFIKDHNINSLKAAYVYNPEEGVNCCELKPSFCLHFIHSEPEYDVEAEDEIIEAMHEEIMEADCTAEECSYVHCSAVNSMKTIDIGEFDDVDEAIEYCQGNYISE